jgi:hypothetical protein
MLRDPVTVSVTRPANIDAYAPGDTIGTAVTSVLEFDFSAIMPRPTIFAYLVEVLVRTNHVTFLPRLRLHLYNAAPPAVADNAQLPLLWADRAKRLGTIEFPALKTAGTGSDMVYGEWRDIPKRLHLPSQKVWARTEILDAGTPASGQVLEYLMTLDV